MSGDQTGDARSVNIGEQLSDLNKHTDCHAVTLSHPLSSLSPGQKTWGAILGQTVNRFSRKFEYFVRKVAREHPALTGCPSSDPPQLPKSQNNYLAARADGAKVNRGNEQ